MITNQQVRKLMSQYQKEGNLSIAAAKAGMDRKTARKWIQAGDLPSQNPYESSRRTREGPFADVWDEVAGLLVNMKKLSLVLVTVLLTIGCLVVVGCGNRPVAVFNEFVKAAQFGTSSYEMKELVSNETLETYSDEESEQAFYSEANGLLEDGVTITATEVTNGSVAIIKYKSEAMGGKTYTATLVTEGEKWKVDSVISTEESLEEFKEQYEQY